MGDIGVQGIDYAYTLQGWIKGVNSDALDPAHDLGQDGAASTANHLFARDAFGYSLGYYNGDFTPIGSSSFVATTSGSQLNAARNDLFNGNIGFRLTQRRNIQNQKLYLQPVKKSSHLLIQWDSSKSRQELTSWLTRHH